MKTTHNALSASTSDFRSGALAFALIATIIGSSFYATAAQAQITTSLDLGSTGAQVTELQTYLSTNASYYPSGLVTGYFGPLTEGGVQKFQVAQSIVTSGTPASTGYGRVGPTTMARINALNGGGTQNNVSWDTVPVMSTVTVNRTNTTATFMWNTNEVATGQVYWSTSFIQTDEATGPRQMPFIGGTLALDAGGTQTNHSVTVSNLQANTVYYYVVRSIDAGGNITMTNPVSFRTN